MSVVESSCKRNCIDLLREKKGTLVVVFSHSLGVVDVCVSRTARLRHHRNNACSPPGSTRTGVYVAYLLRKTASDLEQVVAFVVSRNGGRIAACRSFRVITSVVQKKVAIYEQGEESALTH